MLIVEPRPPRPPRLTATASEPESQRRMPEINLALQADLAIRMLIAAALGAAIGLEREIHEHPAGMRTHLLVSLGSAVFTELSIFAFSGSGPAPNGSLPTD